MGFKIQKLTRDLVHHYEGKIHASLTERGVGDDIHDAGGKWKNARAWLSQSDKDIHLARADTIWVKPDWKSTIIVVHKDVPSVKILKQVQDSLGRPKGTGTPAEEPRADEVIVVSFQHPTLEGVMDAFYDDRLRWWNLQEPQSQSMKAAKNYAYVMLALDKRSPTIVELLP